MPFFSLKRFRIGSRLLFSEPERILRSAALEVPDGEEPPREQPQSINTRIAVRAARTSLFMSSFLQLSERRRLEPVATAASPAPGSQRNRAPGRPTAPPPAACCRAGASAGQLGLLVMRLATRAGAPGA